ncbi:TPA: transporter [Aeromonas sobria]|nr:transporter [Aeromonas sobria]
MKPSIELRIYFINFSTLWHPQPICLILTIITPLTYAVDILPGNGVPPPAGYQAIQLSYQINDLYISNGATNIKNTITTLKYTKALQPLGMSSALFIQPSYIISTLSNKSTIRTVEGVGDTVVAFATWPYVSNEKRRFLGLAGYVSAPTGEYDSNRVINPGTNRWSSALQSGYQFCIYDQIDLMLATDIQLFSKNNDSPIKKKMLEQDELYSYQATFMSPITERFKMAVSFFMHRGGAVEVDGTPISDAVKRERYEITSIYISQFGSFHFQYGADINNHSSYTPLEKYKVVFRYQRNF